MYNSVYLYVLRAADDVFASVMGPRLFYWLISHVYMCAGTLNIIL